MVAVTTLPRSRPFTRADLDAMPDDGHRYEVVDGVLVVSPAPRARHQLVLGELYLRLRQTYEPELIAWELRDGAYVEVARVRGDEEYAAGQPYAVTVRPSDLRID
jgi:Uma2 family endonuclease